ncbi:MAG TPA: Hsp70 family protein, partial [Bacteroidales bacterium]|nr:Hsp70 family protein [Bacteroidales bacterium]
IDSNGILHVSAKDKATGKSQQIRIEASSGLSDAEIKRMKDEATANAEADRLARERVDKLNSADTLIFQTEKQLKEFGDKLPENKKEPLKIALEELKAAHKSDDLASIDAAMEKLNAAWQAASTEMYQAAQQPAGEAPQGDAAQTPNDEVTDVDFEEVKDNK